MFISVYIFQTRCHWSSSSNNENNQRNIPDITTKETYSDSIEENCITKQTKIYERWLRSRSLLHNRSVHHQWLSHTHIFRVPALPSCPSFCPFLHPPFWSYTSDSLETGPIFVILRRCEGWSGCAKVLGKLSVPGRPTNLDDCRVRAYCACSRCGGVVWTFFFSSIISVFFLPLWEMVRYRLKYCLKGPLSPKQQTNQIQDDV